jgi:hypothetical protein
MKVYSLTQVNGGTEVGCYGVFSTPAQATEYAIQFAKDNEKEYSEETIWDGFTKKVYCGDYEFEIWEHILDNTI